MRTVNRTGAHWRKSSYSDGDGHNGNCVEVAVTGPATAVRDSKNPAGPALVFSASAWRAFLTTTR
ncbi:MAG: DUF397 domain-containing protein [Pseudonocardiaceae bacterium]|nr:DUF397 domain-containing protein [Pseudonocardiaceae bacterium]